MFGKIKDFFNDHSGLILLLVFLLCGVLAATSKPFEEPTRIAREVEAYQKKTGELPADLDAAGINCPYGILYKKVSDTNFVLKLYCGKGRFITYSGAAFN